MFVYMCCSFERPIRLQTHLQGFLKICINLVNMIDIQRILRSSNICSIFYKLFDHIIFLSVCSQQNIVSNVSASHLFSNYSFENSYLIKILIDFHEFSSSLSSYIHFKIILFSKIYKIYMSIIHTQDTNSMDVIYKIVLLGLIW